MIIIFTEFFKNECQNKLQITDDQIKQIITNPDREQVVKSNNLELKFFVKRMVEPEGEHYFLVCTRSEGDNLLVDLAFIILPELVQEAKTLQPIILLQELALKFGLTIRVGQQLNKFILKESIPIQLNDEVNKLVEIVNPENHSFMHSMIFKIRQTGDIKIADCSIAYCIDSNKYMSWLTARSCIVFFCYGQPNEAFATKLVDDLRARGVSCWLYNLDSTPGERTWQEIGRRRREADKMIVLCSAESLIRNGVLKEIEEQIDEDPDKIIPISLDNLWKEKGFRVMRSERDLKPFLLGINYVDFSDESTYEDSLNKLLKGLKLK